MSSLNETIKAALLNYPLLFEAPVDVLTHLFARSGNGYAWSKGQLVTTVSQNTKQAMFTEDLFDREEIIKKRLDSHPSTSDTHTQLLELKADHLKRQFIENNIDDMLKASLTQNYFGQKNASVLLDHAPENSPGLKFPKNIAPDWAHALEQFLSHWQTTNQENAKNPNLSNLAKTTCMSNVQLIEGARQKLHPILHDGETFEVYQDRVDAAAQQIRDRLFPAKAKPLK